MTNDPSRGKLPKWARDYICTIERERSDAIRALDSFVETQKQSNVWFNDFRFPSMQKCFIQTDRITFGLSTGEIQVSLEDQSTLKISSTGSLSAGLSIQPKVTNVVEITLTR